MLAAHKMACPSANSRFYLLARCSGRISGQSHSWRHRDIAGFCPKNLTLVPIVPIILVEPLAGLAVAIGFTFFMDQPACCPNPDLIAPAGLPSK